MEKKDVHAFSTRGRGLDGFRNTDKPLVKCCGDLWTVSTIPLPFYFKVDHFSKRLLSHHGYGCIPHSH